jgi:aldehyde dehydrogenase (NAD+)
MFVEQKVYDQVVEKSTKMAKERVVGDPFKPETRQGPQVDKGPFFSCFHVFHTTH